MQQPTRDAGIDAPTTFAKVQAFPAGLGRTLPHSLEAEEMLLSCCLLDGADIVSRCLEARITPQSWYDPKHGVVYEKLLDLYGRQVPIDTSVVAEELKTERKLDQIGGYAFLMQISQRIPTTAQASYFIEKVREQALLRELIRSATGTVEDCYGFSGGIEEFLDSVEQRIFAVTQNRVADKSTMAGPHVQRAMEIIGHMMSKKGEYTGVPSGFKDLDQMTWGFQPANMIILAGRPSCGKTAMALNMAENIVLPKKGDPKAVAFFSMEMSGSELMLRMIASRSRVNMKLLREGMLSKHGEETLRMCDAADELKKAPLFIDDSSSLPVSHIRARARRMHAKRPLGAVFVDYIQLIQPSRSDVLREQQVSEASRGLKALAKELNVPVIVLAQLNRLMDKENRRPKLSDLRESGSQEQDADVVLLIARPRDADEGFQVAGDTMELIVGKQRNGPVGDLKLTFLRDICRFDNYHT